MRKLLLLALGLAVALVVSVSLAAGATTTKPRACAKKDAAGNWEVVLGTRSTIKAAKALATRADAKGLKAATERVGCAKRWQAEITVGTKAKAVSMQAKAKKDGFTKATIEKS
jgi:hypothetical protein